MTSVGLLWYGDKICLLWNGVGACSLQKGRFKNDIMSRRQGSKYNWWEINVKKTSQQITPNFFFDFPILAWKWLQTRFYSNFSKPNFKNRPFLNHDYFFISKICGKTEYQNTHFFPKFSKFYKLFSIFNFGLKMQMIAKRYPKPCDCCGMGLLIDL